MTENEKELVGLGRQKKSLKIMILLKLRNVELKINKPKPLERKTENIRTIIKQDVSLSMLDTAIRIAAEAFEGKSDRGGTPYIMHCLYVMHKVKNEGEIAMVCGVLHDVIEDCEDKGFTFAYLREQGMNEEVIVILQLLTHRKETPYMDYIKALSVHPVAKKIKIADLEHNTKVSRLKGLRKKDFDRLEKYSIAYQYLKD